MKFFVLFFTAFGLLFLGCVSQQQVQQPAPTPITTPEPSLVASTPTPSPTPTPEPITAEKILEDSVKKSNRLTGKKLVYDWIAEASLVKIKIQGETLIGEGEKKATSYLDRGDEKDTMTYFSTKEGEFACVNFTTKSQFVGYCLRERAARNSPDFNGQILALYDLVMSRPDVEAAQITRYVDAGFGDVNDEFNERTVLGRPCHEVTFVGKSLGKIPDDFTPYQSLNKALRTLTSREVTSCFDDETGVSLAAKADGTVGTEGISLMSTVKTDMETFEDYAPDSYDFKLPFAVYAVPEGKTAFLSGSGVGAGFYAIAYPENYTLNTNVSWNYRMEMPGGSIDAIFENDTYEDVLQDIRTAFIEGGASDVKVSMNVTKSRNRDYDITWHSVSGNFEGSDGNKYSWVRMVGKAPEQRVAALDLVVEEPYAETSYKELKEIAESFTIIDETFIV